MHYIDERAALLTNKAIQLHRKERRHTLDSVRLIGELHRCEPWRSLGMSIQKYAYHIGITPSIYYKRLKVQTILYHHPKVIEMFAKGETEISHLALIAARITRANADLMMEAIRNKSKREVEEFVCRVTNTGEILPRPETMEMTVRLNLEQREKLDRSREVLAYGGHVPSNAELLEAAFDALLDKRDPLKKAERAAQRQKKKEQQREAEGAEEVGAESEREVDDVVDDFRTNDTGDDKDGPEENEDEDPFPMSRIEMELIRHKRRKPQFGDWGTFERVPIPAENRHQVWARDKGQCTFVHGNGERCAERMMIEIDHIRMVCRGGGNEVENLRLRCRYHNQSEARRSIRFNDDGVREWYN